MTVCTPSPVKLQKHSRQEVHARFDGARISSEGGALLLRDLDQRLGVVRQAAACFHDHRDQRYIEHELDVLIRQRTFGITLGYEDIADHDSLRDDALLALACGRSDIEGKERRRERDHGKPLAAHATLHRLELARPGDGNDQRSCPKDDNKITFDLQAGQQLFVDLYAQQVTSVPSRVTLDLDNTDSSIHGDQEGKYFNRYYNSHCYVPLYIFTDDGHVLWSELQTADASPTRNSLHAVRTIIERLRAKPGWSHVQFLIRGDSAFCADNLMSWCEENEVGYVLGLQKNKRLEAAIAEELEENFNHMLKTDTAHVTFHSFDYRTQTSWTRERRISAKAEALPANPTNGRSKAKKNPRFIVGFFPGMDVPDDPETRYRQWYAPRGEMENRIKEQQLCLFADRVSTSWLWSNQLRQWFSTLAYVLMHAFRRKALAGTELATAYCSTIRDRLFKIGATIRITTRRIWIHLSSAHPAETIFRSASHAINRLC